MKKVMRFFVTGATGRQGGAVTRALLGRGHAVAILTRQPDSPQARALVEAGAEIAEGDFNDADVIGKYAWNADGIFLMSTPFERGVEEEAARGMYAADAAVKAGVKHIVFSSVADADKRTGIPHFESKYRIEEYLKTKGTPWTIIAPVSFYENHLAPFASPARKDGAYSVGVPAEKGSQMIGVETIGDFAAYVFEHRKECAGQRIDLAADELSGPELAAALSRVLGRKVAYRVLSPDELRARSRDLAIMYEWLVKKGYDVDIPALKARFPEVRWTSFADWAARAQWPAPVKAA